ncbi:MAG: hypothetical protein MUF15_08305 [Acidobacteria bacterium]|jgi:hypothetical protein|nr:hypothetical protein [Acidobacteriota bacterium]
MKVPYNEEIANHIGPESCGCRGNTVAEALTGESIGGQLSSENTTNWVPTLLPEGEGNIFHSVMASYGKTWRSLRTWHVWIPHERESGEPGGTLHSKAGIGESSPQKSPVVTVHPEALISGASLEHENRAQVEGGLKKAKGRAFNS